MVLGGMLSKVIVKFLESELLINPQANSKRKAHSTLTVSEPGVEYISLDGSLPLGHSLELNESYEDHFIVMHP